MNKNYVLNKTYRWMVLSDDGFIREPKHGWGECIFNYSYSTEEEAIKDYQRMIDIGIQCPHKMLIIAEYSITYEY